MDIFMINLVELLLQFGAYFLQLLLLLKFSLSYTLLTEKN